MPIPTNEMAREAQRGLDWRSEYGRGGTEVGIARARDIVNKRDLSEDTLKRMVSFFARHEVDKQAEGFREGEDGYPSNGRIAWALWGGDPGQSWAKRKLAEIGDEKMIRKAINLDSMSLKFAGDSGFEGYASVFSGVDSYNDTIMPGAYKSVIDRIKAGAARMPKMFVNHKSWDVPIGKWIKMQEDEHGLYVKGEFTPGIPEAQAVKAAMQHGTIDGLSIGYMLQPDDIEFREDVRIIKNISELAEVSIVTFPADSAARVDLASVKSSLESIKTLREFENFLRDAGGFSKSLATATAARAKEVLNRRESDSQLPDDLQRLIALNLLQSRTL